MNRIGRKLGGLAIAAAVVLWGVIPAAAKSEGVSLTQPATEIVMPFDATNGKASFLLVSNPFASSRETPAVTTHWIFWGDNCQELANISMCLTQDDTIVVDPTDMRATGRNNEQNGPTVNLRGKRGIVTVTAYETDRNCSDYRSNGSVLAPNALVGTFTIADTNVGYSFGNDALGLFSQGNRIVLPPGYEVERYVLQALNPRNVQSSLVVLSWLQVGSDGTAAPTSAGRAFYANHYDTSETSTSLPDVFVGCADFRTLTGSANSLIPPNVNVNTSGILALTPARDYEGVLFGVVGQAVGTFGASSRVKVERDPNRGPQPYGSPSRAFLGEIGGSLID